LRILIDTRRRTDYLVLPDRILLDIMAGGKVQAEKKGKREYRNHLYQVMGRFEPIFSPRPGILRPRAECRLL
jgi:hypothetical protein